MQMNILSNNQFLDNYILNREFCELSGISSNAYRFWKGVQAAKYDGCRAVFLDKRTTITKYTKIKQKHKTSWKYTYIYNKDYRILFLTFSFFYFTTPNSWNTVILWLSKYEALSICKWSFHRKPLYLQ